MKKIIILFFLLVTCLYPQIQPDVTDFLISGNDNSPSTFKQNLPQLFFTNNNNFTTMWIDYREGEAVFYSQKFDRKGNKIGGNFKSNSNSGIYLNRNGYLLALNKRYVPFFEDTYVYLNASLFNNANQLIFEQDIFSAFLPWCGTGYINGEDIISASDNNFYFLTNEGGIVSLRKVENSGNVKSFSLQSDNLHFITQVTSAATSNSNYFFAWINGVQEDTLETGLYATFINPDDSVTSPLLYITELIDDGGVWGYVGNFNLKSIALNDTTYKLFWLNNASLKLYSVKINISGEIVSNIDSIVVPGSVSQFEATRNMIITNLNTEGFYLFISRLNSNSDDYLNTFIKYNVNGEQEDLVTQQTEEFFAKNLFNISQDNFYRTSSDELDVYLDKMEYFSFLDKDKINDDETGSNEINQELVNYNSENVFSVWSDEENNYGIKVDKNGNTIGEKILLNDKDILFFPNQEVLAVRIIKTDSTYNLGYSIYDQEFNEIFSKIILTASTSVYSFYINIQAEIISDSTFLILASNGSELKLFKESLTGNTLSELLLASGQFLHGGKIFPEELTLPLEAFWISWGSKVRKFSNELVPLTETLDLTYSGNRYVGNNRFLYTRNEYGYLNTYGVVYGTIISSDLDTIKSNIPLSYFENGNYNLTIDRIDDNEFLAVNKYSDKYYARSYSNDGLSTRDSFLVSTSSTSYVNNINFVVNDDKVFFTWSDARTPGKGYDIYGSIFNLSEMTTVRHLVSQVPDNFHLFQNYPNPFNPSTIIRFSVLEYSHINIKVYDILGKEILTLIDEEKPSGIYEVSFSGSNIASGLYFYRIKAGSFTETRKMLLMK